MDQDSLVALWENGAKVFDSDLLTISDIMTMSSLNITFPSISLWDYSLVTSTSNQPSSVMFCQSPIERYFCIDSNSLTLAMSQAGESFMPSQLLSTSPAQRTSAYSCIHFCSNKNSMVRYCHFPTYVLFITDHSDIGKLTKMFNDLTPCVNFINVFTYKFFIRTLFWQLFLVTF